VDLLMSLVISGLMSENVTCAATGKSHQKFSP
jgi:hypothetical protein